MGKIVKHIIVACLWIFLYGTSYTIDVGMSIAHAEELIDASAVKRGQSGRLAHTSRNLSIHKEYQFAQCKKFEGKSPYTAFQKLDEEEQKKFLKDLHTSTLLHLEEAQSNYSTIQGCLRNKMSLAANCSSIRHQHMGILKSKAHQLRSSRAWIDLAEKIRMQRIIPSNLFKQYAKELGPVAASLNEGEKQDFYRAIDSIKAKARSEIAKNIPMESGCSIGSKCQIDYDNLNRRMLGPIARKHIFEKGESSLKTYTQLTEQHPFLAKYQASNVSLPAAADAYQPVVAEIKNQNDRIKAMNPSDYFELINFQPIVESVLFDSKDDVKKHWRLCSIAQSMYKTEAIKETALQIGLGLGALLGLAACPFTGGVTCGTVLMGTSVASEVVHVGYQMGRYNEALSQKAVELIDENRMAEIDTDRRLSIAMAPLAVAGLPSRATLRAAYASVKGAASKLKPGAKLTPAQSLAKKMHVDFIRDNNPKVLNTQGKVIGEVPRWRPFRFKDNDGKYVSVVGEKSDVDAYLNKLLKDNPQLGKYKEQFSVVQKDGKYELNVDIANLPFEQLPRSFTESNEKLAEQYIQANSKVETKFAQGDLSQSEINDLASEYHDIWMENNSWRKDSEPHLFVKYSELPVTEKVKDLDVVESMLQAQKANVLKSTAYQAYRAQIAREVFVEQGGPRFNNKLNRLAKKVTPDQLDGAMDYVRSADDKWKSKFYQKFAANSDVENVKLVKEIQKARAICGK